jgi:hypothetical protein
VVASALGAVALGSGLIAIICANETMLVTLVVTTVLLWAIATVRHATTRPATTAGDVLRNGRPPRPVRRASLSTDRAGRVLKESRGDDGRRPRLIPHTDP